jgi:predicted Rossmann fold nucleotide-binding protein DprA/Smf involved in DNA uptake
MMPPLSPNTQAILLLTAPLIAGRGASSSDLLSPGEYKRLARHLREIQSQPADLLSPDAASFLRACEPVVDEARLQRLLARGFLLGQVIERWQARAIWVVSRADAEYPRRLKTRLREDAPAVIYGCGDMTLLDSGGLAVIGSRDVGDSLIDYTMSVGQLAARAGRTIVSGGAKGIDQAAMRGALEAGGRVSGVLADGLEKTIMNRAHRNLLLDGQLVLISPYDPSAGFNVGHAMQRNKLIYALSDASLVVSSGLNKGGTWAGATEQLDKLKFVPVYVRSTGESSSGLDALRDKGAIPWSNPKDVEAFENVFHVAFEAQVPPPQAAPAPSPSAEPFGRAITASEARETFPMFGGVADQTSALHSASESVDHARGSTSTLLETPGVERNVASTAVTGPSTPAEALFAVVREVILTMLHFPLKDAEVATALNVSKAQATAWLHRLSDDGMIEKQKKSACYIVKQSYLFDPPATAPRGSEKKGE